jgi:mycothiol synthase
MILRAPTLADAPALADLYAELQAKLDIGQRNEEQVRHDLSTFDDVEGCARIALDDGRVRGYVGLWDPNDSHERLFFEVRGRPGDKAVVEHLLDWVEARSEELAAGTTSCARVSASATDATLPDALRARGFRLVRHFLTMEIELADEPPEPRYPDGIAVRTFRPGDERAVYEVDMEAFADHWDHFQVSFEDWREHFVGAPQFDPELWFLAEDGPELAGISLCAPERRADTGHVAVLAVRRPWRGRGLATALLLQSLRTLRSRGRRKADLMVDAENLTGAVRLYERVGMRVAKRSETYEKTF